LTVRLRNLRNVRTDQRRGVLFDAALTSITVVLLEVRERQRRRDQIHVTVVVIMERHAHQRTIVQAKHEVTDVVRLGGGEFLEDALNASLIFVGCFRWRRGVSRHQSFSHLELLRVASFSFKQLENLKVEQR
jgi:hypothetical protein